jgi:hypothetical protein
MTVYDELTVIDDFEGKFGNREAVRRACDLMASYLAEMTAPLPEIATQGLCVAMKYKEGLAPVSELEAERKAISSFLRDRSAQTNYDTLEYCAAHAVGAILSCYQDPAWGGGASELVSNFLDVTEKLESHHEVFRRLLGEYFPSEKGVA